MPRALLSKTRAFACIVFFAALWPQLSCSRTPPVTIRLAGDEWFLDSLTKTGLIEGFEKQRGIRVEVLPKNDRTIMNALDRGPTSAEPAFDVVVMRHRWLGALVQKGQVRPIDSVLADSSLQDAGFAPQRQLFRNWWQELSSYQEHTYGYPFTSLTTFLCYRKDLLEDPTQQRNFKARYHRALKPPQTWQEYSQLAEFFNQPQDHFYGTYIQGKRGLALWYEWLNLVYSFGGNILDTQHGWDYGDIVVNSPQNVAATTQYVKLVAFSPPDTLTFGWGEAQSALQQGHVFMGLLWNDQAPYLEDPKVSRVAGKIGYSQIPSNSPETSSQLEGLTYLIPTESKHPREAYRFIAWAMSTEVQVQQALHGGASARKSTYEDPRVQALPYTSTFLASVSGAKQKPTIPESAQMTEAMERHVFAIVSGEVSPQNGLDGLALDLQRILGGKVKLRYPVRAERALIR
ncbi:MAG TPA: extracellular solute-binding protein [Terriglobales bacterium]|nr:extracellular solute-binding protein [Terriglobales bacterium]